MQLAMATVNSGPVAVRRSSPTPSVISRPTGRAHRIRRVTTDIRRYKNQIAHDWTRSALVS